MTEAQILLRCTRKMRNQVIARAKSEGRSAAEIVRIAIAAHLAAARPMR